MTKRCFGELELAILRLFKAGDKMTVKQVHGLLGEKDKYNTIMTVMLRLTVKKILARKRIGTHYEYQLLSLESKVPSFIKQLKKKIFGVKTSEVVSYLIEDAEDISDADIAAMQQMLLSAKKKKNREYS